jgi:hypothetical protein
MLPIQKLWQGFDFVGWRWKACGLVAACGSYHIMVMWLCLLL